jgi:RNA polymerase sigma factor (TIGR02999 family)
MSDSASQSPTAQDQVQRLLSAYHAGDDGAFDQLFALLYDDLHTIARHYLRSERWNHTLSTTALVHEIYLRIADEEGRWQNRAQFFAFVSRAIRHFLVDYARRRAASKRGGQQLQVTLETDMAAPEGRGFDLLEIEQALERLAARDARLARLVECRFFGGMSTEEIAEALGVSPRTVERDWLRAKAYLYQLLHPSRAGS